MKRHVYIYLPLKEDEQESEATAVMEGNEPSWVNQLDTAPYMGAAGKLLLPTWKAFASHTTSEPQVYRAVAKS